MSRLLTDKEALRRANISAALRRLYDSEGHLGLRELVARTSPDECPFCGDPRKRNPRGRKSLTCGDEACSTAYQRLYKRDLREAGRRDVG